MSSWIYVGDISDACEHYLRLPIISSSIFNMLHCAGLPGAPVGQRVPVTKYIISLGVQDEGDPGKYLLETVSGTKSPSKLCLR